MARVYYNENDKWDIGGVNVVMDNPESDCGLSESMWLVNADVLFDVDASTGRILKFTIMTNDKNLDKEKNRLYPVLQKLEIK